MERIFRVLMLAIGLLLSFEVVAQARGPLATLEGERGGGLAAERSARLEKLDAWLQRHLGRFKVQVATAPLEPICIDYTAPPPAGTCRKYEVPSPPAVGPVSSSMQGVVDCLAIGDGAGVSCVFVWNDDGGNHAAAPLAVLYGLRPGSLEVEVMILREYGALTARGQLRGDSVTFKSELSISRLREQIASNNTSIYQSYVVDTPPPKSGPQTVPKAFELSFHLDRMPVPEGGRLMIDVDDDEYSPDDLSGTDSVLEVAEAQVFDPESPPNPATMPSEDELEEVVVAGQQRLGNRDDIVIWLRRLAGRFRNEGTLQKGATVLPVRGMTECIGVGAGPGMHCVIMLEAPGVETNLKPGALILGVDLETPRVRYTSVDDTGAAVGATGELRGDTAIFRTPCVASFARTCVSTTRITAEPRSESVRFRVEIKMDGKVSASYDVKQERIK